MPLKLQKRKDTPHLYIRGSYLGRRVFQSAGTADRATARKALKRVERAIESGEFGERAGPDFAAAVESYVAAGGDGTFLHKLNLHFRGVAIAAIDQRAVDAAAVSLYPDAAPATRNRQVYTPISAVLKHFDPERAIRLRRPKMPRGMIAWLSPEQFAALHEAAAPKLKPLLLFLVTTGCRVGEALQLHWDSTHGAHVDLAQRMAWVPQTKNEDPRGAHLIAGMVDALAAIEPKTGRVFGYDKRWAVYADLRPALKAAGVTLPDGMLAHVFRHTYATWMRRYAGKDINDLLGTGVWRDLKSVQRYQHVVASESARAADNLPVPGLKKAG